MGLAGFIGEKRVVEVMTDDVGYAHDWIGDGFVWIEIGHGVNADAVAA